MMAQSIFPTIFIVVIYCLTGAWIGSLDADDTVADMLWGGAAYGILGMAVIAAETLLLVWP